MSSDTSTKTRHDTAGSDPQEFRFSPAYIDKLTDRVAALEKRVEELEPKATVEATTVVPDDELKKVQF